MNEEAQNRPLLQKLLDNMWLLLLLDMLVYSISYIAWGWMEISTTQPIPEEIKQEILK